MLLQENGFKVYGAGSAVTRHVMSDILSAGRPGTEDLKAAGQFGADVVHKIMTQPENFREATRLGLIISPLRQMVHRPTS